MSTLQARIEDYVGTIADTTALTDQLTAGAKIIVDSISDAKAERYSANLTDAGTGISVAAYRVIRAHKSGYNAPIKSAGLKGNFGNSASIHYPSTTSPVAYIENGSGFVLPSGGTFIGLAYPSVLYTDTSIANFPTELEHGVILYAAIQQAMTKLNTGIAGLDALTFDAITAAPSAPIDAAYSYTDASLGTYSATTIDFTGIIAPTYTKPTITLLALPAALDMSLITPPASPSAPVIAYTDAATGTYTATTIGALGTAPTYTKPTTTTDFTNTAAYIATEIDTEKAQTEINHQNAKIEIYGKDLYNELNEFNKELEIYKTTVQNAFNQATLDQERILRLASDTTNLNLQNKAQTMVAAIEDYKLEIQKYLGDLDKYKSQINTSVTEYAQNLSRYQVNSDTLLRQYAADIQNELNEFNKETEQYRALIQKAVRQAELDQDRLLKTASDTTNLSIQNKAQTLTAAIELYKSKLGKYGEQIQEYSAQVNNVIGQYSQKVQKFTTELTALPSLIQSLKVEFNEFLKRLQ